jgi:hypothetical protein
MCSACIGVEKVLTCWYSALKRSMALICVPGVPVEHLVKKATSPLWFISSLVHWFIGGWLVSRLFMKHRPVMAGKHCSKACGMQ